MIPYRKPKAKMFYGIRLASLGLGWVRQVVWSRGCGSVIVLHTFNPTTRVNASAFIGRYKSLTYVIVTLGTAVKPTPTRPLPKNLLSDVS